MPSHSKNGVTGITASFGVTRNAFKIRYQIVLMLVNFSLNHFEASEKSIVTTS